MYFKLIIHINWITKAALCITANTLFISSRFCVVLSLSNKLTNGLFYGRTVGRIQTDCCRTDCIRTDGLASGRADRWRTLSGHRSVGRIQTDCGRTDGIRTDGNVGGRAHRWRILSGQRVFN